MVAFSALANHGGFARSYSSPGRRPRQLGGAIVNLLGDAIIFGAWAMRGLYGLLLLADLKMYGLGAAPLVAATGILANPISFDLFRNT